MKKLFTLILCWLLAFEAFGATTFKAKTAASVAGGYVTSLNKVDGSFEDGASAWSASVGTIVPTASTEFQGNFKGVWAGTGTGTLDLQWTATASNTYEASAQVNVNGEDDVYVCAYVGTTETGCKLIPALTKIQKVSAVADSVLSSAFYLRLKHTGSDAFSVDADDGKIEPWTPQAVNLVEQESVTYTGYTSKDGSGRVLFATLDTTRSNAKNLIRVTSTVGLGYTKYEVIKPFQGTVVASTDGSTGVSFYCEHYNSSGVMLKRTISTTSTGGYATAPIAGLFATGDYFIVFHSGTPANNTSTNFSVTAQAVSENVVQSTESKEEVVTIYQTQNAMTDIIDNLRFALQTATVKINGTSQSAATSYRSRFITVEDNGTLTKFTANQPTVLSISVDGVVNLAGGVIRIYKGGSGGTTVATSNSGYTGQTSVVTSGSVYLNTGEYASLYSSALYNGANLLTVSIKASSPSTPTLLALPTRSEVFSVNVSVSGSVSNATQNFVTSCTNATPSVCSLWSSFGVAPICWAHTLDITKRAEVTATTATTATVARTDTSTAFNLFCHLK